MSIEDISFPNNDFEMSPSINSYETNQSLKNNTSMESLENAKANAESSANTEAEPDNKQTPNGNTNQNESNQSSLGSMSNSESSGKTNASETGKDKANTSEYSLKGAKKAVSYQDIHSEYTKKRYKHIESKVGKYIANMRALDEKRRETGKLLTHRSLPETLSVDESNANQQYNNLTRSIDSFDCSHYPAAGGNQPVANEASSDFIYLNTTYYKQLLKDKERKDYLQAKLEEKNTENCRLKQNLDKFRIQLSQYQDRLKVKPNPQNIFTNYDGNMNAVGPLAEYSLSSLLSTLGNPTKSTQTEITLTPSPILTLPLHIPTKVMANTPMTPEFQNGQQQQAIAPQAPVALKLAKCVAAIQPISLNFSSLLEQTDRDYNDNTIITMENKSTPAAIHITPIISNNAIESVNDSMQTQTPMQSEQHDHYTNYFDSQGANAVCEKCYKSYRKTGRPSGQSQGKCKRCKHHTVRYRLLHLIGSCITCKKLCSRDLCESGSSGSSGSSNAQKSPYSHVPLLETRFSNHYHTNT